MDRTPAVVKVDSLAPPRRGCPRAPDTDCPSDSLTFPRRVVNRCRARPFVAADLAAVLATCHRPRQRVAATWSPTRLPVRPGAAAPSAPQAGHAVVQPTRLKGSLAG